MSASPPDRRPGVDVAIVNWNTADAALESAGAYLASEAVVPTVTVIDNDSLRHETDKLRQGMPSSANLILSDENLGFGRGANRALASGSSEFVCVSNADVIPTPTALSELVRASRDRPRAGIIGPAFAERSDYHARLPRAWTLWLRPLAGGFGHRGVRAPGSGSVEEIEQPAGACFLMRRDLWERIGGFDEDFFLWFEDVDLAKRLEDLGHRNLVAGDAIVHHAGAGSVSRLEPPAHQAARIDGVALYTAKHHPRVARASRPVQRLAKALRARGPSGGE